MQAHCQLLDLLSLLNDQYCGLGVLACTAAALTQHLELAVKTCE